ncbi:MAG: outer membrane protein assembly factor BamB [Magnetococcales bacterium]|nr:outer membrane protein assembly factor BamB [Magnetococcales bacterium]
MKHQIKIAGVLLASVLLSGCFSWSNPFSNPFSSASKEPSKADKGTAEVVGFVEPQTKEPTGLTRIWKESVASSPSKHHQHPDQIVVAEADIFVGTFQGRVVRLNRENGRVLWEVEAGDHVTGGVAVEGSRVFAGTKSGEMVALARDTGKELWRSELSAPVVSAPEAGNGKVLFLTLDSRTYALNSEDGKRLWTHSTPPETLVIMGGATPTIDGRVAYVGYSSGDVFALSLENGVPLWVANLSVSGGGRSELDRLQDVSARVVTSREGDASATKRVYAVNHQGRAVALQPRDGSKIWEHKLSAIRRPWLAGSQLFFSDMDGYVVALDAGNGLEMWRTRVSDGLLTAPVVVGSKVLVADNRGRLMTLEETTGRVVGMDRGDAILADPVVVDKSVFLWTNEGNLLRYDF